MRESKAGATGRHGTTGQCLIRLTLGREVTVAADGMGKHAQVAVVLNVL